MMSQERLSKESGHRHRRDSVSYTHLDVYKRQAIYFMIQFASSRFGFQDAMPHRSIFRSGRSRFIIVDVYKRQRLICISYNVENALTSPDWKAVTKQAVLSFKFCSITVYSVSYTHLIRIQDRVQKHLRNRTPCMMRLDQRIIREAILEDIARTGGVYYAYPVKEAIATPPPDVYKRQG